MSWAVGGALVFLAALFAAGVHSSQLRADDRDPFVAYGNGTMFDISKVFTYPVQISDAKGGYSYVWDPRNVSCGDQRSPGTTVCQHDQGPDLYYSCGTSTAVWLLQQYNPFVFQIWYTNGIDWRISVFTFQEDTTIDPPTIDFVSEAPYLQYNFLVKGRCVGQQTVECTQGKTGFLNLPFLHMHNATRSP